MRAPLTGHRPRGEFALAAGIVLLALNLRPAITSLPSIFPQLEERLDLSSATVTALATLPLLTFAACSTVAGTLGRRMGEERVLGAAAALLMLALVARAADPALLLFPTTIVAAAAITVINVVPTSLIKRQAPKHAGRLVGGYLFALYLGGTMGTLVTPVLYTRAGHSFLLALGCWAALAAVALPAWSPQLGRASAAAPPAPRRDVYIYRNRLAWQVATFFGVQSTTFYACVSWLPTLFQDRGATAAHAGFLASMLGFGGLATALLVPIAAHRAPTQRSLVPPVVAVSTAGLCGTLFAPMGYEPLAVAVLGAGLGASMGLSTYFMVARAASPGTAAALAAMSQTIGYVFAAIGPAVVGAAHAATHHWNAAMSLLFVLIAGQLALGLLAARPLTVADEPAEPSTRA